MDTVSERQYLTREEAAAALTHLGYPITERALASFGPKGNGPPYRLFGRRAIYRWFDLIHWAEQRGKEKNQNVA
jgi:hypothetical protein